MDKEKRLHYRMTYQVPTLVFGVIKILRKKAYPTCNNPNTKTKGRESVTNKKKKRTRYFKPLGNLYQQLLQYDEEQTFETFRSFLVFKLISQRPSGHEEYTLESSKLKNEKVLALNLKILTVHPLNLYELNFHHIFFHRISRIKSLFLV